MAACWHHDAGDMPAEVLLGSWPPRHKLESEPVIDHGEPARLPASHADERYRRHARLQPRGGAPKPVSVESLAAAASSSRRRKVLMRIASEHDPLPLAARQSVGGEMIDAVVHRVPHLGAKSATARRRLAGEKLPIRARSRRSP